MRFLVLVACFSLALPNTVWAQDTEASSIPVCSEALTLRHGQLVPCLEGVLLPPPWALEAARLRTVTLPRCQADLSLQREQSAASIEALEARLNLCLQFSEEQSRLLDSATASLQPTPFWKSPVLWAVVGFVAGAATTVGIVYAVDR